MPRCSSGDCGVCVAQGEIMVRFGRCCCQVHGVAAPRLNLPEPQRQLLAEGLQAPEDTSKFLKVTPHLDCCLIHARSVAPPQDTDWTTWTIACCIFPYALVEKNPSPCERWMRNVMRREWTHSDPNSFITCWVDLPSWKSHVKHKAGVTAVRMEVFGVVCHCQTHRGAWRALGLRTSVQQPWHCGGTTCFSQVL